jgi:nucleoside phosphorylase
MNIYADVLIVTATKAESKAIVEVFQGVSGNKTEPIAIGDRMYHDLGIINGARVFFAQSEMGASGLGASQQTVQKGIEALSPEAVIMTGIAFGIDAEKQSIGDILVSLRLRLYELLRVSTEDGSIKIIPRDDRPHASPWLLDRFRSADIYWDESKPKVRFGLILSGEKLVDNIDFREQLREFEPEAIGGEMEGSGLYVACQDAKVDWILVKSICDWADGCKAHNEEAQQGNAAHNAASFVLHVLQMAPLKREGKQREPNSFALLDSKANAAISMVRNEPRMNAYSKFMELMSMRPIDTRYAQYRIMPQLETIQLYSSPEVREIAKEIHGWAITEMTNSGKFPHLPDFGSRVNNELKPIIKKEIEDLQASH